MSFLIKLFGLILINLNGLQLTVAQDFKCTKRGRFIDETDPDCNRYFLCSQKKNGQWVQTTYYCPASTNFDIDLGYCTSEALCVSSTSTTSPTESTTITSNSNYSCTAEGKFSDTNACDCGWFFECSLVNSKFSSVRLYCPPSTKFNPSISGCSSDYECAKEFVCTEEGLFLDELDVTKYFSCSEWKDGSFLQELHTCPLHSVFNQTTEKCAEVETTTTAISVTTTIFTNSETDTTEFIPTSTNSSSSPISNFQCDGASGRFPDPEDNVCKWYYLCISNQSFHYSCPIDLYFNPLTQECSLEYQCPKSASWSTESWTKPFHCKKRGYFKKEKDYSCKTYHFCDILGDGKIYQYDLICPDQYIFDSNVNVCSHDIHQCK